MGLRLSQQACRGQQSSRTLVTRFKLTFASQPGTGWNGEADQAGNFARSRHRREVTFAGSKACITLVSFTNASMRALPSAALSGAERLVGL